MYYYYYYYSYNAKSAFFGVCAYESALAIFATTTTTFRSLAFRKSINSPPWTEIAQICPPEIDFLSQQHK